jgi:hypothetical protein
MSFVHDCLIERHQVRPICNHPRQTKRLVSKIRCISKCIRIQERRRVEGRDFTEPIFRQIIVRPTRTRGYATNIWKRQSGALIGKLIIALMKPFMQNSKQGGGFSLYLATSPEVAQVSGEYFAKFKPAKSNPRSRDPKLMTEVWQCTGRMASLPLP